MVAQQELFNTDKTLAQRYDEWKEKNPSILKAFFRFADAAARKQRKFGAKMVAERLRWFTFVESNDEEYKINNNYVAYIARDWKAERPFYEHLIETRAQRA